MSKIKYAFVYRTFVDSFGLSYMEKKIFIVQANTQNMHITAVGIFWISFDFKIMFRFDFCSRFMWN